MKQIALAAFAGLLITGGMFAGLVEKEVAETRGEAAIALASATDNTSNKGTCTGRTDPMCFPQNCTSEATCPTNNQCTGLSHCRALAEVVGPGQTVHSCRTYGACESSDGLDEDLSRYKDESGEAPVTGPVAGDSDSSGANTVSTGRTYTSYY